MTSSFLKQSGHDYGASNESPFAKKHMTRYIIKISKQLFDISR